MLQFYIHQHGILKFLNILEFKISLLPTRLIIDKNIVSWILCKVTYFEELKWRSNCVVAGFQGLQYLKNGKEHLIGWCNQRTA